MMVNGNRQNRNRRVLLLPTGQRSGALRIPQLLDSAPRQNLLRRGDFAADTRQGLAERQRLRLVIFEAVSAH